MIEAKTEKAKRKSIQEIRTEDNKFVIKANPAWPNMFKIHREKGNVPNDMSGQYTSQAEAQKVINSYMG